MNIKGKRILLRAIEVEDLTAFHGWSNDADISKRLGEIHFPSSRWQVERWYERIQADEKVIRLVVQHVDGSILGHTGFWNIHWRDRRAEHALVLAEPEYRGKGYGREVILTCARYAFEEIGLYRLDASILETNTLSLKVYKSCGFQVEGTLRGHALREGVRVNRIMMGLLATEYSAFVQETEFWSSPDHA